jgi:DNA polymerase-3 subunit delta
MIIFLYGPDTYRAHQKLNEIIGYYKKIHQSGLNLKFFEGESLDFQDFKNWLDSTAMFKEKKLSVLKDIFSNQNFKEEFLRQKEKLANSSDIILIFEKKEIAENDPLFQFLKKNSKTQEFKLLESQNLKNWVKKEFEKYGTKITPKALEVFLDFVGNNLWQASNEIKKLVSYKNRQKIEIEDVKLLVKPKIETDIFKTIDALAEKNKKQALKLLHKHLEKEDSPLYLLAMINFQFRNLLVIKEMVEKNRTYRQILNQSGLHPFLIKKSYFQARKFTFEELKKIYQKIFEVDLHIKTGRLDPQTALDLLIAENFY